MRIACLRVAALPLVAELRAHPEIAGRPLAIASAPGPRAEIVAASREALAAGLRLGASVVQGRSVCAGLVVRVASPAAERAARAALLDVALSFSPRAQPAPQAQGAHAGEAAVWLDASGVRARFASEQGFASAVAERAVRLGLPASVTVAGSARVARIAARGLPAQAARVIPPGDEARFLAPLPLDLLEPDDELAELLTRLGVQRAGDLARLPRRALAQRFGPAGLELAALARGEADPVPLPAPPETPFEEAIDLEAAVDRFEPLGFVLRGLLARLLDRLALRGLACGDLDLHLGLEGGGRDARRVGVAAATLDARTLLRLVRLALEAQPPGARIESLTLVAQARPPRCDQLDLYRPAGPAPAILESTLAALEALCGAGRVGAPLVPDDHRPDAFALGPFAPGPRDPSGPDPDLPTRESDTGLPLALRAIRPPVLAEVRCAGGVPRHLRSAVASGEVTRCAGPFRISGRWWCPEGRFLYDHFDVAVADGTLARLRFDHLARRWEIDAVYD
jgi:protein ImuB